MKIIYTYSSFANKGGLERIFVDKANALAQKGHEVHILCNFDDSKCSFAYKVDPSVKIHNIQEHMNEDGGMLTLPFRWLSYRWRLNKAAKKILAEINADILVMTTVWILRCFFKGAKHTVLESHGNRNFTFNFSKRNIRNISVAEKKVDLIVALTKEDAENWHGKSSSIVIPNYTDIQSKKHTEKHHNQVCYVGRLDRFKGVDLLIDAWRKVHEVYPQSVLHIYGEGDIKRDLQIRIDNYGLNNYIILKGKSDDVSSVYTSHDFLVLSSQSEGFGLVLIEAMTCGCPCVSVDCPSGPREVIADGEDGLLVEYRGLSRDEQVQRLADAICRMLADPAMCRRMGEAAARNVGRFDRTTIMARWEQLFQSLLTTKN